MSSTRKDCQCYATYSVFYSRFFHDLKVQGPCEDVATALAATYKRDGGTLDIHAPNFMFHSKNTSSRDAENVLNAVDKNNKLNR